MQALEIPKTGHIVVDFLAYVIITIVVVIKALSFLRAQGLLPGGTAKKETAQVATGMFKSHNGGGSSGGGRSAELWEYRIAEIVEKKLQPLADGHERQSEDFIELNKKMDRILLLLETQPRTHRRD